MIYMLLVGIALVFILFFYSLLKVKAIEDEQNDYDEFKS